MQVPGCNLKNDRMISVCFQGKPFNMRVIQVYVPATSTKEAEVNQLYEDLDDLLGLTAKKKRCSVHHWGLECNSRKSRDTCSKRQVWPWRRKWSRTTANWILPRNALVIENTLSTTQEMTLHMDITKWPIPKTNWLHFFVAKDGDAV